MSNEILIKEGMIKLEPTSLYDNAIIGTLDNNILYEYEKIIHSLVCDFMTNDKSLLYEDALINALEWYDYNILRSLDYIQINNKPIILKRADENFFDEDESEFIKFNGEFWIIM